MPHRAVAIESPGAWLKFIVSSLQALLAWRQHRQADWTVGGVTNDSAQGSCLHVAQSVTQLVQRRITMAPGCYSHLWTAQIPKSNQS